MLVSLLLLQCDIRYKTRLSFSYASQILNRRHVTIEVARKYMTSKTTMQKYLNILVNRKFHSHESKLISMQETMSKYEIVFKELNYLLV